MLPPPPPQLTSPTIITRVITGITSNSARFRIGRATPTLPNTSTIPAIGNSHMAKNSGELLRKATNRAVVMTLIVTVAPALPGVADDGENEHVLCAGKPEQENETG